MIELTTSSTTTEVCPTWIVQANLTLTMEATIAPTMLKPKIAAALVSEVIKPEEKIESMKEVPIV